MTSAARPDVSVPRSTRQAAASGTRRRIATPEPSPHEAIPTVEVTPSDELLQEAAGPNAFPPVEVEFTPDAPLPPPPKVPDAETISTAFDVDEPEMPERQTLSSIELKMALGGLPRLSTRRPLIVPPTPPAIQVLPMAPPVAPPAPWGLLRTSFIAFSVTLTAMVIAWGILSALGVIS